LTGVGTLPRLPRATISPLRKSGRGSTALDGGQHRAAHAAEAQPDRVQQRMLREQGGGAACAALVLGQRDPVEVERAAHLLERDALATRHVHDLGHDLEGEAADEAMLQERSESFAAPACRAS
jgi:hypothetical protein